MAVVILNESNFDVEVLESDKPVLVDFFVPWCGSCRKVSPIMDEIANEVLNAKVGMVNVDENPELAQKYSVVSIPTLVVIKDGKVVQRVVGAQSKSAIMDMLNA